MPIRPSLILLTTLLLLTACATEPQLLIYEQHITEKWIFSDNGGTQWLPATVPGTVHTDLHRNGEIPDPFYGTNEHELQWIGEQEWIYKTTFTPDSGMLEAENVRLIFEGVDTYATIYLNGQEVAVTDNMFREWEIDCRDLLQEESNSLEVHFNSALQRFLSDSVALGYPLPGGRWVFARKAAYHFGWDWGPRFITAGIWKPVKLVAWNSHRPEDMHISTRTVSKKRAHIDLSLTVTSNTQERATIRVTDRNSGKVLLRHRIKLMSGNHEYHTSFTVKNPILWWSNGLGEPHIYDLDIDLITSSGSKYRREIPYGIKTLRTVLEDDEHGKSLYVELNGVPVFMKGANYIPQHSFVTEVSDSSYRQLIADAAAANMNMLRVWGGGIYEKDLFYELCNRNGILVWQDFMFACAMYPGSDDFLANVREEATQQVKRLRNHSNIALWCGNNEVDEGWHNWGWQRSNRMTRETTDTIWKSYTSLFHELLPEVVAIHDPGRFYLSTSPLHGWGREVSLREGSAHYWGVWWGRQSPATYLDKVPRFMSEYGLQAMPSLSTIRSFQESSDDYLFSAALRSHQKHPTGYENIATYLAMENLHPKTLTEQIYMSQLVQAEGIGLAIEAHRRAMPYCMGTLYWQLNDCWPVVSWSGIDYHGNYKALHYKVKNLYDDIMVSALMHNDTLTLVVVSDRLTPTAGTAELFTTAADGSRRHLYGAEVTVAANSSKQLLSIPRNELPAEIRWENELLEATFTCRSGREYHNSRFLVPLGSVQLTEPEIVSEITPADGGFHIRLTTDSLVPYLQLTAGDSHARFSDNYFHLRPGEEVTVFCRTDLTQEEFENELKISHLAGWRRRD